MIIQSGYVTVCYQEYGDFLRFDRIANKALHPTVIPLRFIAAGELGLNEHDYE